MSAPAYACQFGTLEQPSNTSRTYENEEVGFSFLIPENYRAMGTRQGVLILEPATFDYVQCVIQNNLPGEGPPVSVSVYLEPVTSTGASLRSLVFQAQPWLEREGFDFRDTTFAGRPALAFSQLNRLYDETTKYMAVVSPDRRMLIMLVGPQDGNELERALSSFAFE